MRKTLSKCESLPAYFTNLKHGSHPNMFSPLLDPLDSISLLLLGDQQNHVAIQIPIFGQWFSTSLELQTLQDR